MRAAPAGLCAGGRSAWDRLGGPIAHRGLWGADAPENTLSAFARAVEAGYGVELDVRLSADGVPMVFHDADLERMTGDRGPLAARTARELQGLRIGSLEGVPTLGEALRRIGDQALTLIELKDDGDAGELVARALDVIGEGARTLAIISFSAAMHREVAHVRPDMLRGVHLTGQAAQAREAESADAHFLLPSLDALEPRDAVQVAWTARSPAAYAQAAAIAEGMIFEGFRPEPRAWR